MTAPTYDQLTQLLRDFDGSGATTSVLEMLPQMYPDDDERRKALLDHLRSMCCEERLKPPPTGLYPADKERQLAEIARARTLRDALDVFESKPAPLAVADSMAELLPELGTEPERPDPAPRAPRRVATGEEQDERFATKLFRVIDDLSPALPAMLFVGYLHCWRLADWKTGEFHISHLAIAQRLGSQDRSTGKRVMQTLVVAGLVRIVRRGAKERSTDYRLTPLDHVRRERVLAAVMSTWMGKNPSRWKQAAREEGGGSGRPDVGGQADPTPLLGEPEGGG